MQTKSKIHCQLPSIEQIENRKQLGLLPLPTTSYNMANSGRIAKCLSVIAASILVISMVTWNIHLHRNQLKLDTLIHKHHEHTLQELKILDKRTEKTDERKQKRAVRSPPIVSGGATYVRWGRSSCPNTTDSDLVYNGVVGGSHFTHTGGGSNYLCLPRNPQWKKYGTSGAKTSVCGAEFHDLDSLFGKKNAEKLHDHNAVCSVCRTATRSSQLMIPARLNCYNGWTKEYEGYLVTAYYGHKGRTTYICLDHDPEADQSGYKNEDGVLMYKAVGACGSLPCPNYVNDREITCVVCTK